MKKIFKILKRIIIGLVLFLILYLAAAFLLPKITINAEEGAKNEVEIYIITNGVHTDIVVPARNSQMDWTKKVLYKNTVSQDTNRKYLGMGWGDKGFYLETPTWAELKFSVGFKAATGLGSTAIHATYYSQMTESETCKKIVISKEQYTRLVTYISNSFQITKSNDFVNVVTDARYGKNDAFYEATGSYSIFKTCNTWANKALKVSGQKCCFWTSLDKGIFSKYK